MQSSEIGLSRNRDFFEEKQASDVLMAASQSNSARNPNQLRKR
jgi:hypothetical protein